MSEKQVSVDFEVFGEVQGVFFRKHTAINAKKHNCVGWVMNTKRGTVQGVVQGMKRDVESMKHWLENIGSPHSTVEKAVFSNERQIDSYEYKDFSVRH